MIVGHDPTCHLTYCLNIHPGETLADIRRAILEHTLRVRSGLGGGQPFGLGLRLGITAARELADAATRQDFRSFLDQNGLYVFTINGFPYGQFHGARVKERVYEPDWRTPERLDYTILLADILADLLPADMEGSISTVPCSYKPWVRSADDVGRMAENLSACATHLDALRERTGRLIHLGLEPEPGCYLETTHETVAFFRDHLFRGGKAEESMRRHVGVCFDTCHMAIQFEDLAESMDRFTAEGILVSKVQLSAALDVSNHDTSLRALWAFDEPIYLHQVRAQREDGTVFGWSDLPEARKDLEGEVDAKRLRVHFHVPLFWEGSRGLGSTASSITPAFLDRLRNAPVRHLEIETYTFEVLPKDLVSTDMATSIRREYDWVLARLDGVFQ